MNTSTNHQAAYKFTGTIHTSDYTLDVWGAEDADGTNLYRNKNAKYFLPTENEWVKAAYWNGTSLQTYATKAGESLYLGNGSNGGWNYDYYPMRQPWNVGSGSEELNGTYDMMGNMLEWMESPDAIRGGAYADYGFTIASSYRYEDASPYNESHDLGFRVASIVPEPCSLALLGLGGLVLRYRK